MMGFATTDLDIDSEYRLQPAQIDAFRESGFIKLGQVLSAAALAHYGAVITDLVMKLNNRTKPMAERNTYEKAFIQIGNLWEKDATIREFCFGLRLGRIAAELMGTTGTRMYHDQALYKEAGGGFTPWHADQFYWPLATMNTVTAWIPLQPTPLAMGPVGFAPGSHRLDFGRDLGISDRSEQEIRARLAAAKVNRIVEPFALGDVSFHYGWTFHNADGNDTDQLRRAMTIIYMDEDMRLKRPDNNAQQDDWDAFCPGIEVGELCHSPKNPIVYSSRPS